MGKICGKQQKNNWPTVTRRVRQTNLRLWISRNKQQTLEGGSLHPGSLQVLTASFLSALERMTPCQHGRGVHPLFVEDVMVFPGVPWFFRASTPLWPPPTGSQLALPVRQGHRSFRVLRRRNFRFCTRSDGPQLTGFCALSWKRKRKTWERPWHVLPNRGLFTSVFCGRECCSSKCPDAVHWLLKGKCLLKTTNWQARSLYSY